LALYALGNSGIQCASGKKAKKLRTRIDNAPTAGKPAWRRSSKPDDIDDRILAPLRHRRAIDNIPARPARYCLRRPSIRYSEPENMG
jgi:hypothetical protein